jgi:hypothetical protein
MKRLTSIVAAAACWIAATTSFAQSRPEVRVVKDVDQRPIAVEATGWTKEELALFANPDADAIDYLRQKLHIYVLNEKGEIQLPAIGGGYSVTGEVVRLTPQYALRPGMSYQAVFYPPGSMTASPYRRTLDIMLPAPPPAEPTRVTAIYPSASVLPENQLRFYVHFSAPMAAGNAYEHVTLYKANGEIVKRAFLEIGEELWDGTGTRITLLFDPGRVKKGLSPRLQFGPVLETGQEYRLVIEKTWRDANNQPLTSSFEKKFTAGPPVETAVSVKEWKILPPAAGSAAQSLTITFPRSLDRALLQRMITVVDSKSREIDGEISLADDERHWSFLPAKPLPAGDYSLVIDTALEDSAGNNVARPFEIDIFDRVDKTSGPEFVKLPFVVR